VLIALAFAAPLGLGLVAVGALWVTRRALSPIDRVIRVAGEVGPARLDRRIPVPARDDELRALVVQLNGLLDRVQAGYAALDSFAADASHELRTPISVMASELEIALRRPRSSEEWERVGRTALDEVRRLGRLCDALLRIARADHADSRVEIVDAATIVDQVIAGQGDTARAAGVTLVAADGAHTESIEVAGDPDALASALSNVVANAVSFSPRGGVVTVTARRTGETVELVVDDAGPGLDPTDLEQIFVPFHRGTQGREERDGFGLGLAIARRIVERHGGRISAANRAEGGARFAIELTAVTPGRYS
jgi:signal transduction histidine kinase